MTASIVFFFLLLLKLAIINKHRLGINSSFLYRLKIVEIKQLAVVVKKNSSSLLKQISTYLLSNYSANQGKSHIIQNYHKPYFPLQFI